MRYLTPLAIVLISLPALAGQPAPPVPTDVSVNVTEPGIPGAEPGVPGVSRHNRFETRIRTVMRPETYTEMVPVTKTRMVPVEEEYQVEIREFEVNPCDPCAPATASVPCSDCTSVSVNATGPAGGVDVNVRRKGFFQKLLDRRRNRSLGVNVRL